MTLSGEIIGKKVIKFYNTPQRQSMRQVGNNETQKKYLPQFEQNP